MIPLTLFLLACAAVYVGTIEVAFSTLMRLSLRLLAERNGRAGVLGPYLDDPLRLFVGTRLLLGLILGVATLLLARLTGVHGVQGIGGLLLSVSGFIILFEQMVPLLIARRDPERALELLLPSFTIVVRPLRPLMAALVGFIGSSRPRGPGATVVSAEAPAEEAEVAHAYLDVGEQEGLIERDEHRLLQSIVDFGDTLVREVMTPRPDIVAIRSDATLDELLALFREQEYSRIPVYQGTIDNILGFVFVKDLIKLGDKRITGLLRPAYVVPKTKRVSALLKEFQRHRVQSAIVVDEYGGTAGLVTIEDLLEEIVGEIRDEYDVESEPIVDEGQGTFVFTGRVDVDELAERLHVKIEREGFETVGGYLLAHLGRVPAVGETFELDGLSVQVLEAERRRVTKVRVRRLQPVESSEPVDSRH